jgi:hypothetical protein
MLEMPRKTITYLKIYCGSYPMVLSANYFSTFNETLRCRLNPKVCKECENIKRLGGCLHLLRSFILYIKDGTFKSKKDFLTLFKYTHTHESASFRVYTYTRKTS